MDKAKCLIDGCGRDVHARGLCQQCMNWELYHLKAFHGLSYFKEWQFRYARSLARTSLMVDLRGKGIGERAPKKKPSKKDIEP